MPETRASQLVEKLERPEEEHPLWLPEYIEKDLDRGMANAVLRQIIHPMKHRVVLLEM
jgi:hypothetical protein